MVDTGDYMRRRDWQEMTRITRFDLTDGRTEVQACEQTGGLVGAQVRWQTQWWVPWLTEGSAHALVEVSLGRQFDTQRRQQKRSQLGVMTGTTEGLQLQNNLPNWMSQQWTSWRTQWWDWRPRTTAYWRRCPQARRTGWAWSPWRRSTKEDTRSEQVASTSKQQLGRTKAHRQTVTSKDLISANWKRSIEHQKQPKEELEGLWRKLRNQWRMAQSMAKHRSIKQASMPTERKEELTNN